jgi:phage repressor protein C with HTH and peptisase S24 domain
MENSEKQRFIESAFHTLRTRGVVNTYQDFAKLLGVSRNSLSAAKNGNETYLTDSLLSKIQSALDYHTTPITEEELEREMIPVLPTDARAGTLAEFSESVEIYNCERMVSPIRGADFAMQVTGDSMSPEYPSGSVIICKKINEKAFIEWGKVFVLDTPNGAVIKSVRKTDDDNEVECVSLNPAYQPFRINTEYINGWYRVLMVLSLK